MANKNFLLLSLGDSKTKKIANVVSNDSCRKILDYLSKKEATESELAEKLQIPISTVHYNLQQLMETGLINTEEFHYSKKGKEVLHYKLANKYIIISPKKTYGIKQKLRGILPVALIAAGTAGIIQLFSKYFLKPTFQAGDFIARSAVMEKTFETTAEETVIATAAQEAAPIVAETAVPLLQNIALWFLVGALFALIIYSIWSYFRKNY